MVRSQAAERQSPTGAFDFLSDVVAALLEGLVTASLRVTWWAILFPMFSVPTICTGLLIWSKHYEAAANLVVGTWIVLVAWRLLFRRSWERWVTFRIRYRRQRRRYTRRWAKICALHGLTAVVDEQVLVPAVRDVGIGVLSGVDRILVSMTPGQTIDDWHKQTGALAHALKVRAVTVESPEPGAVLLTLFREDTLHNRKPLPIPTKFDAVDLTRVIVGWTDVGQFWEVPILYRHVLIAGATGSGKGSVIWSIIAGLAPDIRRGLVSLRVIDPKGGMELGPGEALFDEFAYDSGESMLTLLRNAVAVMQQRADRLRGVARLHVPTVEEPLTVIIVDEMATLTAYGTDRKIKLEAEQLLGQLLSQGRAVGVTVIGALQDPSKEVLGLRQLFPVRIALRMSEQTQVAMVLGHGARDQGARCDEIPDSLPGVGYVMEDGTALPKRVRAFYVSDEDIDYLAANYRRETAGELA